MRFDEILSELREGKKIRRRIWSSHRYIRQKKNDFRNEIIDEENEVYTLLGSDLDAEDWEIKMTKVKLRDMDTEQLSEYCKRHKCGDCVFNKVACNWWEKDAWVKNKEFYSDWFLNWEVELEDDEDEEN